MKISFSFLSRFLFLIWSAFVLNIVTWLVVLLKIRAGQQTVALHYSVFYGPDYAGRGYLLYLVPAIGLSIWLANYAFYRYAKERDIFGAQMLGVVSLVVQIFVLIAVLFLRSIIV